MQRDTAVAAGVGGRVDLVHIESLGLLRRHAAGMITINSTSGLSAIHHGTPLMVIGDAIYAHPDLAECAEGNPDFDRFWTRGRTAAPELRSAHIDWIRETALKPGDFYAASGIPDACEGVFKKTARDRDPQAGAGCAVPVRLPRRADLRSGIDDFSVTGRNEGQ